MEKSSRLNEIYRKDTEKKTGKKVKVTHLKILEDDEGPNVSHHDVTRSMGHKFSIGNAANNGGRKMTPSQELMADLDII